MSHRKNPGNTKHVRDGHWFVEVYGTSMQRWLQPPLRSISLVFPASDAPPSLPYVICVQTCGKRWDTHTYIYKQIHTCTCTYIVCTYIYIYNGNIMCPTKWPFGCLYHFQTRTHQNHSKPIYPAYNIYSIYYITIQILCIYICIYIYILFNIDPIASLLTILCIPQDMYACWYRIYVYTNLIISQVSTFTCEQFRKLQVHGMDLHKFGKVYILHIDAFAYIYVYVDVYIYILQSPANENESETQVSTMPILQSKTQLQWLPTT